MASDIVEQLVLGVGSSAIAGTAVWAGQRLVSSGRQRARCRFYGLTGGWRHRCRLVVGRNPRQPNSIHQSDVAAMLEIAQVVRAIGVEPQIMSPAEAAADDHDDVEFCLTARDANPRTRAHLERWLPGLRMLGHDGGTAFVAGDTTFQREPGVREHVVVARICRPGRPHLWLVAGQTGITNHAGARFLVAHERALRGRFGDDRTFCLVLRVVEPDTYGYREVEELADVTAIALTKPDL
jgi:hypothetical protein